VKITYKQRFSWKLVLLFIFLALIGTGCAQTGEDAAAPKEKIVFADAGWDSIRFHNEVARLIIEEGYGYPTDVLPGSTPSTFIGLRNGDIDAYMEVWIENIQDAYNDAIEKGEVIEASVNFDDNAQGYYVPTYVIEGDPARGIEPMAPDLKSVTDLPRYWELFRDPEEPGKGRIYGAIPGWAADEIMQAKHESYGLSENFAYFSPGSDAALSTSISSAVEAGEPWVGYYWEPTWITGKYDLTLLAEPEFDEEKWNNGYACEFPANKVTVAVNQELPERAPEVVDFLKNYKTSSAITSEALAYMIDSDADAREAAKWFLSEKEDLWTKWVPADVAEKVKAAL